MTPWDIPQLQPYTDSLSQAYFVLAGSYASLVVSHASPRYSFGTLAGNNKLYKKGNCHPPQQHQHSKRATHQRHARARDQGRDPLETTRTCLSCFLT
uniref:Uncharacterized protein n=1 Tax=Picea glauca TaxID=3330 RepID=A0A117NI89_PICGL|nr:hypothetical protein ABT39_MTgene2745 [Picea glauca]QHR92141.1 hypothetical protein Q903MT_gene6178 [Picea sitchensis]